MSNEPRSFSGILKKTTPWWERSCELIRTLSTHPAKILQRPGGSLAIGEPADVSVLSPEARWIYDPVKGYSKSRNSPWAGQTMEGRATATIVGGRLVYDVARGVLAP